MSFMQINQTSSYNCFDNILSYTLLSYRHFKFNANIILQEKSRKKIIMNIISLPENINAHFTNVNDTRNKYILINISITHILDMQKNVASVIRVISLCRQKKGGGGRKIKVILKENHFCFFTLFGNILNCSQSQKTKLHA